MKSIYFLIALIIVGCVSKKVFPSNNISANKVTSEIIKTPNIDLEDGKYVYENVCGNCHKFYEAKTFDKLEWKNITTRMQDKTHLNDTDIENVYQYIISTLH